MWRHVGDTLQREGIFISFQWEMIRGWSGGGRRSGNFIVCLNPGYSGGVCLRTRYRSGKIFINRVLLSRDGVPYVGSGGGNGCTFVP